MNHKIDNVNDFVNESINFLLKEVIKVPQTIYILTSEWVSMHRVLASYYLAHLNIFWQVTALSRKGKSGL